MVKKTRTHSRKLSRKYARYLAVVPRGTRYSIEYLNTTYPMLFPGGMLHIAGVDIPTNLMWQNIVGTEAFPNFERYKLLSMKVKFIASPAFWNSTPQVDGSPPFFGGVHMCSYHVDQTGLDINLDFVNKRSDAKHYDPHTARNMVCTWYPNPADTREQQFNPLPLVISAADYSYGGIRVVVEGTNDLPGENPATAIGELQVTYKIVLIGKLGTSFTL